MNRNAVEDLRWIAAELNDLSALLQTHSKALAGKLGSVAELIEATLWASQLRPAPTPAQRRREFYVVRGG
jgi:hypothetical protein